MTTYPESMRPTLLDGNVVEVYAACEIMIRLKEDVYEIKFYKSYKF